MKLFRNILIGQTQLSAKILDSSGITNHLTVVATTDGGATEIEGFYLNRQHLQAIRDNIDNYLSRTEAGALKVSTTCFPGVNIENEFNTVDQEGAEIIKMINQRIVATIEYQKEAGVATQQWVQARQEQIENYSKTESQFNIDPSLVTTDHDESQQNKDFAWKAELNLVTGLGQMILFAHGNTEEQARVNLDGKVEDLMCAIACKGSKLEIASIRLAPSQIETGKGSSAYCASYQWYAKTILNEKELVGVGDSEEEAITKLNIRFQQIVYSLVG